jgi:photosystem I P700 chlorophyll a apoprotein A1
MSGLMLFAGWFHYHKAAPKLEWFQNAESMLNHHLSVLLGMIILGLDTKFILEIPLINY